MTEYPCQVKALAIVPKFTGSLSIVESILKYLARSPFSQEDQDAFT